MVAFVLVQELSYLEKHCGSLQGVGHNKVVLLACYRDGASEIE